VLVRGKRVYPRHLFPEIVAPWIQLKRLRMRVIWFFTTPIHIVPMWTTSVAIGILGVMLTILLFRGTPTVHADLVKLERAVAQEVRAEAQQLNTMTRSIVSTIPVPHPVERLTLPFVPKAPSPFVTKLYRLTFDSPFDQKLLATRTSMRNGPKPVAPFGSRNFPDGWAVFRPTLTPATADFIPYIQTARVWTPPADVSQGIGSDLPPPWNAAEERHSGLSIAQQMSPASTGGEAIAAVLTVHNDGRDDLDQVIVSARVSDASRVQHVEPEAEEADGVLYWLIGPMHGGEERRLTVYLSPRPGQQIELLADAQAVIGVGSTTTVKAPPPATDTTAAMLPVHQEQPARLIEIPNDAEIERASDEQPVPGAPQLKVTAAFPESVDHGQELSSYFVISNVGTADADDIVLTVQVPSQLEHHDGSLVEHRIARLVPGESRRAIFKAIARQDGVAALDAALGCRQETGITWAARVNVKAPRVEISAQRPANDHDRVKSTATAAPARTGRWVATLNPADQDACPAY
jgi:hypothetical protein